MVNGPSLPQKAAVRRRQIGDGDLAGVSAFLSTGFRLRPASYWMRGFARLRDRAVPDGYARYGYLIESDGRIVGVLLTIFSTIMVEGEPTIRCNLSSWYVEPGFRQHAPLLISYALKDRGVTYLNISAAPNTWPTIQVQGFRPIGTGKYLAFPALGRAGEGARVLPLAALSASQRARLDPGDLQILDQHAGWGCTALVVTAGEAVAPFVFARQRIVRRLLPTLALVYCRDMAEFARFAAVLGRYLLVRGAPSVLLDAAPGNRAMPGFPIDRDRTRFARGPHPPDPGDIAFTEGVFFGA